MVLVSITLRARTVLKFLKAGNFAVLVCCASQRKVNENEKSSKVSKQYLFKYCEAENNLFSEKFRYFFIHIILKSPCYF